MLEIAYIYVVILACLFVYKTLANDPEREKIWGSRPARSKFTIVEKKFEDEPLREKSMA